MSLASPCFNADGGQPKDLARFQALSLDDKMLYTRAKIRQFYLAMKGKVYVSFSGGKDSTVLLHLVRSEFPEVPAVFCDTGLEFPEFVDARHPRGGSAPDMAKTVYRELEAET